VRQAATRPFTVSEFIGKSGTQFKLQLLAINEGHREGELCLRLLSNGVHTYSVSFILLVLHGEPYVKIGCLQGLRSANGALWIKRVTRELHGCRPKNLMVSVVRDIGNYFHCKGALLVSNKNRISINLWRRRQITSNYDQTWEEMSATLRADGDFELPCTGMLKIAFDELPSRKRSEAKKRGAMVETVFQLVRARLNAIKLEPDRAMSEASEATSGAVGDVMPMAQGYTPI
jgi:uncharacterized protein